MVVIKQKEKRIVFFNHKGGVGKTTLTVNLAYALVRMGKRVLVVDTDPQCSVSSFFLEETFLDKLLDESEAPAGTTLWSAVQPVSEGTGPLKEIQPVQIKEGLFLAVGDIRLAHFENVLAESWNQCLSRNRRGLNCTTAISQVVDNLVAKTKADYVFFDSGPNIGPLNRAVLLDCTHFLIPAACDLFSSRALKTLGFALSDWVTTWERIREIAPDKSPLLTGTPKLLGYVPQAFRVYRGGMVESSLSVLLKLEGRVTEYVWRPLQAAYQLPAKDKPSNLRVSEVKYFGSLVTLSQEQGLPIWSVSGGSQPGKDEALKVFLGFAKKVEALTA